MDIDISILTCLQFITIHEKLTVKFFIQLIKNQASFRGNQCTVCIGIALVSDVTDRLTLGVHIIHHMNEVKFIVSVITIALSYSRVYSLQGTLYDIMHLLNLNLILPQRRCMLLRKPADKFFLFVRKCI